MQEIVDQLKAEGKVPTLEQALEIMAEVPEEYRPKILAARAANVVDERPRGPRAFVLL